MAASSPQNQYIDIYLKLRFQTLKFNLVFEWKWTNRTNLIVPWKCFCGKKISQTFPLLTSFPIPPLKKNLIKEVMVPFEVSSDHNWRWHIRCTEGCRVCTGQNKEGRKWLLWLRNKVIWYRLPHLPLQRRCGTQLRKPSTAHSTSKWRLKLQGYSALEETDPLEPDHYVLSCQVSPDWLHLSTSETPWKWHAV